MSLLHRHQWTTLARTYRPPPTRRFEAESISPEMLERMLYGITTINQECATCGLGRAYTVSGDAR